MTRAIITHEEIPGQRFRAMFRSSAGGTRYRYNLPVMLAIAYVELGLYGAEFAHN